MMINNEILKCPEGHENVELRSDIKTQNGKIAVLCRLCLELFYIDLDHKKGDHFLSIHEI